MTTSNSESAAPPPSRPLTAEEAAELLRQTAEFTRAALPLPEGLLHAAESCESPVLAAAFRSVAQTVRSGASPSEAIAAPQLRLAAYWSGIIAATARTGRCGEAIQETLAFSEEVAARKKEAFRALAYPTMMLVLSIAVAVIAMSSCGAILNEVSDDAPNLLERRDIEINFLVWFYQVGYKLLLGWIIKLTVLCAVLFFVLPKSVKSRLHAALPVFGAVRRWGTLAQWCRLAGLLVQAETPLPEAFELAAAASSDADLAAAAKRAAAEMRNGTEPVRAIALQDTVFSPSFIAFVKSGIQCNDLARAFRAASDSFFDRMKQRSRTIAAIGPPFMYLAVLGFAVTVPLGFLSIIMEMIGNLSISQVDVTVSIYAVPGFLLAPPIVGFMVARRLLYRFRRSRTASTFDAAFEIIEWRAIAALILVCATLSGPVFAGLALAAFVYLAAVARVEYAEHHQRMVLMQIAIAAKNGFSLPETISAAADELFGTLNYRTHRWAEAVERGESLASAARTVRWRMPTELAIALHAAETSGDFGKVLMESLDRGSRAEEDYASATLTISYLWWTVAALFCVLSFMLIKTVPDIGKMYREFDLDLPSLTRMVVDFAADSLRFIPAYFIIVIALTVSAVLLDRTLFRLAAFLCPPLELLRLKKHGREYLRSIASVIRAGRPLEIALSDPAERHPLGVIRRRAQRILRVYREGGPWIQAVHASGLISAYDAAILKSAERAGNLPWCCDEIAERSAARAAWRMRFWLNLVSPVVILAIGLLIGVIVVALFMPLCALTLGMARAAGS